MSKVAINRFQWAQVWAKLQEVCSKGDDGRARWRRDLEPRLPLTE